MSGVFRCRLMNGFCCRIALIATFVLNLVYDFFRVLALFTLLAIRFSVLSRGLKLGDYCIHRLEFL